MGFKWLTLCLIVFAEYHTKLPDVTTYQDVINSSQLPSVTFESTVS